MNNDTLSLLPDDNHFISLDKAKAMTALYRSQNENILAAPYQGKNILSTCETFDRSAFDALLSEIDCAGIRIYFGMTDELKIRVIAVAVDKGNKDILPLMRDNSDAYIVEEGRPCPDYCPDQPL